VLRKRRIADGSGVGWRLLRLRTVGVHPLFHPLPGLMCIQSGGVLLVHPPLRPLPGPTHFLCLAKESKQRKARPRWRPLP